jgi:trehalose/maltose hydrolase-like predicted phosphorylase
MAISAPARPRVRPRNRPFPPEIERRFEALIFDWDGTAVPDRSADASDVRDLIEGLCRAGMDVFVVSGTHVGNVDGQLGARPEGPGELHLCLNRGSEVFRVAPRGPRLTHRRSATQREERALDLAAAVTIERLGARGLEAAVVSQRLNRRKIDLIPLPEWADPPKAIIDDLVEAVDARVRAAGFAGLPEIVNLALAAATEAGLPEAKVTSDAKHVEIGLTDKTDSARWIAGHLATRGIGPGLVLIAGDEMGPLGGLPGSDSLMLVPELGRSTSLSVGVEPSGVPRGVLHVGGGPDRFIQLLEDQLRRRLKGEPPGMDDDPGWSLSIVGVDPQQERAHESLMALADGRIGTGGSPLLTHAAARPLVLTAGAYDGPKPESQLLAAPLWDRLQGAMTPRSRIDRLLDLRTGLLFERVVAKGAGFRSVRFSSLARPGLAVLAAQGDPDLLEPGPAIRLPADAPEVRASRRDDSSWTTIRSEDSTIATTAWQTMGGDRRTASLVRIAAYVEGPPRDRVLERSSGHLRAARNAGVERLIHEHRAAWARRWSEADVTLEGDVELQRAIRFGLFHLMASVADAGEAAVGARGLSGPGYAGHVFWDSDVFVLPFLAATHPSAARAMLEYRIRRLPAALDVARERGREGARFPWESAASGRDVTPTSARDRRGRLVPIRTGLLEEHIVADVAWAACCYADWTGDREFLLGRGRGLLVETARYWASRIRWDRSGGAHIYGVIGPDEYHEPVDDNAFTNVMARWNLRRAAALGNAAGVSQFERLRWLEIADALIDGLDPRTKVYEQFAEFHTLEPLIIAEAAPRRPIAADLLLGRERVHAAQVIKQADVLMLHHLIPDEVAPGSLVPNLEFYEPRTAHGSSLSPAIHAALFARTGRLEEAESSFRMAALMDLDDLTGTTSSGLHLATMGGVWQALAFGFAGMRPHQNALAIDPQLPSSWGPLEIRVRYQGTPLRVRVERDRIRVNAGGRTSLLLGNASAPLAVHRGQTSFERSGHSWKEAPK